MLGNSCERGKAAKQSNQQALKEVRWTVHHISVMINRQMVEKLGRLWRSRDSLFVTPPTSDPTESPFWIPSPA
jgi:hypothetical protein